MKKLLIGLLAMAACSPKETTQIPMKDIQLITLDPGHFHAALVQKKMYDAIDSTVHIYAPPGPDLALHMAKINAYNDREDSPTAWKSEIYESDDFFKKMISDKAGNVVVMAGNNAKKTDYIYKTIDAGFSVLADKPMVIDPADYDKLKEAFEKAKEKNILLYDIMTERSEITTVLQKALSQQKELFGELITGTLEEPAVTKESVHHYFKYVSGSPLIRPSWFFDTKQQGEGIVDVTTHLVDLTFWECFPEQVIKESDVELKAAKRWSTDLTLAQFQKVTGATAYPDFLANDVNGDKLEVYANGEIDYTINGHYAKVSVIWNYEAPEGTGDTHYSIMRGTKANLVIQQTAAENYKPTLYIESKGELTNEEVSTVLKEIAIKYPGVSVTAMGDKWKVEIPEEYNIGHEAHFGQVMERFIDYYQHGNMPAWEVPNMLTKYKLTTDALKMATK